MSVIVLLVEGSTENALKDKLKEFLDARCEKNAKPKIRLETRLLDSRLLKKDTVHDLAVKNLARPEVIGVVALMDVKCSGRPLQFHDAAETIAFLRSCVPNNPRYRAHAAQFDFEAWLLPYWNNICKKLRQRKQPPGKNPELVDLMKPPSVHLKELYRLANHDYHKPRDAKAILKDQNLIVSATHCPQFKSFLNSLLFFADCELME